MTEAGSDFGGELLSMTVKRLLLDRIVRGHYRPGERIVEMKLARELGTSQSPVREALRDLAAIGVVAIHPRRGARVRMPSGKELADVSVVRSEIDALAARLAVEHLGEDTLATMDALVDEMLARLDEEDFPAVTQADVEFHRLIASASTNQSLLHVFDQLAPFARTFITLTLPDVDVRGILLEHRGILAALRDRDVPGAAEAARRHQLNVSSVLLATQAAAGGASQAADQDSRLDTVED